MPSLVSLTFPEADLPRITFDDADRSVNLLSREVLAEFAAILDQLAQQGKIAALIIDSAKPDCFLAGADVNQIADPGRTADDVRAAALRGQQLFRRLSEFPFPTIAALSGVCVGGGAELALWCDRRIAARTAKTQLGFPEVKLGLCPGWGGSTLLPRTIGLPNAVDLATRGESITADEAKACGLVDDVVSSELLWEAARRLARSESASSRWRLDRQQRKATLTLSPEETQYLAATAGAMIARETKGRFPAPAAILELLLATSSAAFDDALNLEADTVAKLFATPERAALTNVFLITDRAKRSATSHERQAPQLDRVGLVGVGIMGIGIAAAHAKASIDFTAADTSSEALSNGIAATLAEAAYDKKTKQPDPLRAQAMAGKLHSGTSIASLASCDLVIEAAVEAVDIKRKLFAELESVVKPTAILATNTSTIPIGELAKGLQHPERFCGLHFFNPVRRMRVVEVIRGPQTSPETVAAAAAHVRRLGKMPIIVGDRPGFVVNRVLSPYLGEAMALFEEGVTIEQIDKASVQFGMPLGPFALYDLVGIDTAYNAGKVMWMAYAATRFASPVLPAMLKAKRLGVKNGLGFYNYQNKKREAQHDPAVAALLDLYVKARKTIPTADIQLRLFLPMVLEATRVLDEGLVSDPRDIDLGVVYGLGLSPHTGGILHWADRIGAAKVVAEMERFATSGPRWKPTERLLQMAANGRRFYDV
jgi:3-hydroxyacyl-CoA dehydrogenase/enoyl-CoA hydratase/carnithine racemase